MEIKIVKDIRQENEVKADEVRSFRQLRKQSMFNIMSSPGSGKTSLLEKLIPLLQKKNIRTAVIEGDITTDNDARRLQPLNIPISLINTEPFGGDCHLGAHVILAAMETLADASIDLYLVENVGNLVCPAEFDTGADRNLVVLSVTEGEDKPLKYPLAFRVAQAAIISKVDLVPVLQTNVQMIYHNLKQINPQLRIFEVSTRTGEGLAKLAEYLVSEHGLLIR